jgi:branched-chain amino acid transport system permease protein
MVGGLVVGIATEVSTIWVQPSLKFVFALVALVLALLIRPQGILGRRERIG